MTITLSQTDPLFTLPLAHNMDFTELADYCEHFAEVLVECDNPAQKIALCGRLSACLALLEPTLLEPIPDGLKASLTVEDLPASLPAFEPDTDQLAEYCQTLTQLLMGSTLNPTSDRVLSDLLYELTRYFADTLRAPRWLSTPQGVFLFDELH
ncbi:hypothetical protein EGM70_18075 [Enterobacteriaceae bacterium 89]|nr:hypothetical protein [Enterobacteriaceae bacterium 89]